MNAEILATSGIRAGAAGFEILRQDTRVREIARVKDVINARPNPVQYTQGAHDAINRQLPTMVAELRAQNAVFEKALAAALTKITTLTLQVTELQERVKP